MTENNFKILLDGELIGTTALENADVPMSVVYGHIDFENMDNAYTFFKSYCLQNKIGFSYNKQDQIFATKRIPNLKVNDNDNNEIQGSAIYITGKESKKFDITIEGVPPNNFNFRFKNHIEHYKHLFDRIMDEDKIAEIGLDEKEGIYIKPEKAQFPLIYRTASGIHWDEKKRILFTANQNGWTSLAWYKQMIGVIETECNYKLKITPSTVWTNISDELKIQIIEA